jgi:hypothetical protein
VPTRNTIATAKGAIIVEYTSDEWIKIIGVQQTATTRSGSTISGRRIHSRARRNTKTVVEPNAATTQRGLSITKDIKLLGKGVSGKARVMNMFSPQVMGFTFIP